MLCLPAKTTSNKVDWSSSLSKYVARAYSKAQAEAHKEQFRRVDELRRQVAAASEARLEERTAADARGDPPGKRSAGMRSGVATTPRETPEGVSGGDGGGAALSGVVGRAEALLPASTAPLERGSAQQLSVESDVATHSSPGSSAGTWSRCTIPRPLHSSVD